MEHRGGKRGKQAGSGIRRRANFHEGLEHFVKYYVFTKNNKTYILELFYLRDFHWTHPRGAQAKGNEREQ